MPHRVSNWGSLWIPNQASQWRSWWSWMFCAANSMKPRRFLTPGYIGRQLAVRLLLERARSEGQAEGHGNDLDLVRIDHALLGVDVVDAALDVAIDHSEMQGDAGSAVDPEMRAGDRGRRDPLRLGLQVVGAQPRDDIRTNRTERQDVELEIRETRQDLTGARDAHLRVVEIESREVEIEPRHDRQLRHIETREALDVVAVLEGVTRVAHGHAHASTHSYRDEAMCQADLGRSDHRRGRQQDNDCDRAKHGSHGSSSNGEFERRKSGPAAHSNPCAPQRPYRPRGGDWEDDFEEPKEVAAGIGRRCRRSRREKRDERCVLPDRRARL